MADERTSEERLAELVMKERPSGIVSSTEFYKMASRCGMPNEGREISQVLLECTLNLDGVDMRRFLARHGWSERSCRTAALPAAVSTSGSNSSGDMANPIPTTPVTRGPAAAQPTDADNRAVIENVRQLERLHRTFYDGGMDTVTFIKGIRDLGIRETVESRRLLETFLSRSGQFSFGEFLETLTHGTPFGPIRPEMADNSNVNGGDPNPQQDDRRPMQGQAQDQAHGQAQDQAQGHPHHHHHHQQQQQKQQMNAGSASPRKSAAIPKNAGDGSVSMADILHQRNPHVRAELSRPLSPSFIHPQDAIGCLESGKMPVNDWRRVSDLIQRYKSRVIPAHEFFRLLEVSEGIRRLDFADLIEVQRPQRPAATGVIPVDRPVPFSPQRYAEMRTAASPTKQQRPGQDNDGRGSGRDAGGAGAGAGANAGVKVLSPREKPAPQRFAPGAHSGAGNILHHNTSAPEASHGGSATGFGRTDITRRPATSNRGRRDHGNVIAWTGQPEEPRPQHVRRDAGNLINWTTAPTAAESDQHHHAKGHIVNHNAESSGMPFNHAWGR